MPGSLYMPGSLWFLRRSIPLGVALVGLTCLGAAAGQELGEPYPGAPHNGLIKNAIYTRVFGKPTIPHIVKLIDAPGTQTPGIHAQTGQPGGPSLAAGGPRKTSSMPVIGRVWAQGSPATMPNTVMPNTVMPSRVMPDAAVGDNQPSPGAVQTGDAIPPETLPSPAAPAAELRSEIMPGQVPSSVGPVPPLRDVLQATDDVIPLEYGHRTFSYHNPWDYGTVAGSYVPSYFANYRSYYAGYSPAGFYGPAGYRGGYSPYAAYAPYSFGYGPFSWGGYPFFPGGLGAFGSWYGYRPWNYPSYYTALFGTSFAMPPYAYGPGLPYGYGPGVPYGPATYAGCYYW